jgi:hypothetical protein
MRLAIGAALFAAVMWAASAFAMPAAHNYTPLPQAQHAGCVAYQVCQTCYRQDGHPYTCNCHMECLPGIH